MTPEKTESVCTSEVVVLAPPPGTTCVEDERDT